MRHRAIALALVIGSLKLAAQNSVNTGQPVVVIHGNVVGHDCPIGMRATQGYWDRSFKVRQGQQEQAPQTFGQRIFLSLVVQHPAPIVSATVKVRGLNGKSRIQQTETVSNVSGDAVKIMRITFVQRPDGAFSDLYAPGFTSVSSIELLEIAYADGNVWKIGGSSVCSVTPDPMMLIANH